MKHNPDNRDLAEAFESLKAEDSRRAGPFQDPDPAKQRQWRVGKAGVAAGFAGAAIVVIGLFNAATSPGEKIPAGEPIAFDHMNEVIFRELFVASVSEWESPTGFLLNPESNSSNSE